MPVVDIKAKSRLRAAFFCLFNCLTAAGWVRGLGCLLFMVAD
jgi:hypothetical protein